MPELPEVETLRRELSRAVVGKTIKGAAVHWPKMVRPLSGPQFSRQIKDRKITSIGRQAKILVFALSGGEHLAIHLKLTGQLIYAPRGKQTKMVIGGHPQPLPQGPSLDPLNKDSPFRHTRAVFNFTDGSRLFFNDLRKFGWLRLAKNNELDSILPAKSVEPLGKDFTLEKFVDLLERYPRRKIKQFLMDQALIAGLGNIYADESCFHAKVRPTRPAGRLSNQEKKALHRAIIAVLKLAISKKGTSADTYVQLSGKPGGFAPYLKVYSREGKKCKRCGGTIRKIKLNGRGTHFCPRCQR